MRIPETSKETSTQQANEAPLVERIKKIAEEVEGLLILEQSRIERANTSDLKIAIRGVRQRAFGPLDGVKHGRAEPTQEYIDHEKARPFLEALVGIAEIAERYVADDNESLTLDYQQVPGGKRWQHIALGYQDDAVFRGVTAKLSVYPHRTFVFNQARVGFITDEIPERVRAIEPYEAQTLLHNLQGIVEPREAISVIGFRDL